MIKDNKNYNNNVEPNTEFLNELRNKLPDYFSDDGEFDLDKFKRSLKNNSISELKDGYQLKFIGKEYARRQSGEKATTVIVPDEQQNNGEGRNSENLFFTGDNLEVLRHMQNSYTDCIDIIYMDPPYNTGNRDFIYPDEFEYSDEKLKEIFNLDDDALNRLKSIEGSSSHSAWLTFMYPRLYLAKKLLSDDGVLFISINDNEVSNLIMLANEVFGESNFVENYIWESNFRPDNTSNINRKNAEFILMYAKNKDNINRLKGTVEKSSGLPSLTKNSMELSTLSFHANTVKTYLEDGIYKKGKRDTGYILHNDIEVKNGLIISDFKLSGHVFWGQKYLEEQLNKGTEIIIKGNGMVPYSKKYETNSAPNKIIPNMNNSDINVGDVLSGRAEVSNLFEGNSVFQYPKPTTLIKYLIKTVGKESGLVLDMFAGSGSTADAVMQLNYELGSKFNFIMIQLDEKTYKIEKNGKNVPTKGGKSAYLAGYKSVSDISMDRIKKASRHLTERDGMLVNEFDGSFKHYSVVSPSNITLERIDDFDSNNIELFNNMIESFSGKSLGIDSKATGEDTIVNTWLLSDGYKLNSEIKDVDLNGYVGKLVNNETLYLINEGWNSNNTKSLLNHLGKYDLNIKNIIIFGYSFNIAEIKELEIGLKQLDVYVNLLRRY